MRVCYFGTYRANYARNQNMIEGLRRNGVEVIECQVPLWFGIEDRVQVASGGWIKPTFWWRVIKAYYKLLKRYKEIGQYDIMIVGYPGQIDILLAKILTSFRHKPLVWDILMSLYLVAIERGLDKHFISIKLIYIIEWLALRFADILIIDTEFYRKWIIDTYGVKINKFRLIPIGADDRIFKPIQTDLTNPQNFQIIYYGSYIKNHGTEYIIEAANILRNHSDIIFLMIGEGPERQKAMDLATQYELTNIQFINWLEKNELTKFIGKSDVCLGTFGETPQSLITIHNKIYEGLAMKKPVVTGASPAIQKAFIHEENIFLCKRKDPKSLANAILTLKLNPIIRQNIAENGYKLFCEKYNLLSLGKCYKDCLLDVLKISNNFSTDFARK